MVESKNEEVIEEDLKEEKFEIGIFQKIKKKLFGDDVPVLICRGNGILDDIEEDTYLSEAIKSLKTFAWHKKKNPGILDGKIATLHISGRGDEEQSSVQDAFDKLYKKVKNQVKGEVSMQYVVELTNVSIAQHYETLSSNTRKRYFISSLMGELYEKETLFL